MSEQDSSEKITDHGCSTNCSMHLFSVTHLKILKQSLRKYGKIFKCKDISLNAINVVKSGVMKSVVEFDVDIVDC